MVHTWEQSELQLATYNHLYLASIQSLKNISEALLWWDNCFWSTPKSFNGTHYVARCETAV